MSAVRRLPNSINAGSMGDIRPRDPQLPAEVDSDWECATDSQRSTALQRYTLVMPIVEKVNEGVTLNMAAKHLVANLNSGHVTASVSDAAKALSRSGKFPSVASLKRWTKDYEKGGRTALMPAYKGRVRQDYGWEADAIALYNIPSKTSFADVADALQRMGWDSATNERVAYYLKSLPATLGKYSPARVGAHTYRLNHTPHVMRDKSVLLVGEIYQGDGHTVDVYLAHPNNGAPWRPELTVWIDVRSRYIVGWYLSESESSHSTLFALSHAMVSHDHVPATLYIDNGSGFKSKLMNDESTGFYERFSMSTIFSIPGNPRAKGDVEGWFRIFRDKHDKFWNRGRDYCGHDQSTDTNLKLSSQVRNGKRKLLSLDMYRSSVGDYIEHYNNKPSKALDGLSPAQLWNGLQPVPVVLNAEAVIRPRAKRVVRKWCIKHEKRVYRNDALMDYEGKKVTIEYDLHDDRQVWLYDSKQRLICIAQLVDKVAYMPQSRLDEARDKRLAGQKKRLERKLDEVEAAARSPIDSNYTQQIEALAIESDDTPALTDTSSMLDIDITDWSDDDD